MVLAGQLPITQLPYQTSQAQFNAFYPQCSGPPIFTYLKLIGPEH